MVAAYGSFLIADYFHVSGVLATVTAGLMMANFRLLRGKSFLSPRGQEFILGFWDFAAFLANSVVFLLIGVAVAAMPLRSYGVVLLTSVVVVLLGRGLTVYPLSLLFLRSRWTISLREQHILLWGGLRGALALALALGERQSRSIIYRADLSRFRAVALFLLKDCCAGRPDICAPLVTDLTSCRAQKARVHD